MFYYVTVDCLHYWVLLVMSTLWKWLTPFLQASQLHFLPSLRRQDFAWPSKLSIYSLSFLCLPSLQVIGFVVVEVVGLMVDHNLAVYANWLLTCLLALGCLVMGKSLSLQYIYKWIKGYLMTTPLVSMTMAIQENWTISYKIVFKKSLIVVISINVPHWFLPFEA